MSYSKGGIGASESKRREREPKRGRSVVGFRLVYPYAGQTDRLRSSNSFGVRQERHGNVRILVLTKYDIRLCLPPIRFSTPKHLPKLSNLRLTESLFLLVG
jgi:hypothetical protein